MKVILSVLLTIFLLISHTAFSQNLINLTIKDGLSDMRVSAIYKDNQGYIWLGGNIALNRFDGKNIRQYHYSTSLPRSKSTICSILQTASGELWIGNYSGVWKLNTSNDTLYQAIKEINFPVYILKESVDSTLYMATYKGFYTYKNGKIKNLLLDKNLLSKNNQIADIYVNGKDDIWILTVENLYQYNPTSEKVTKYALPVSKCISLIKAKGCLFIGTKKGEIYTFNIKEKKIKLYLESPDNHSIFYFQSDGKDKLYYSNQQLNILSLDTRQVKTISLPRENSVSSFLVDNEGQMWIGTFQSGVFYSPLNNGLFKNYKFKNFDSNQYSIRSLYIKDSKKLIGTSKGLFYIDEKAGIIKNYNQQNYPEIRSNFVNHIIHYGQQYFIAFTNQIFILDERTLKLSLLNKKEFLNGSIHAMQIDKKGNLWIGKQEGLYCYFSESNKIKFNALDGLGYSMGIFNILIDKLNRLWLVTSERICLFNAEEYCLYPLSALPANFPYNQYATNLYEDKDGSLLFCLTDGDLIKLNSDLISFKKIDSIEKSQLPKAILKDNLKNYWVTTECNIFQILPNGKKQFFNTVDGLDNPIFTNVLQKDENGNLWIGTTSGLLTVNPSQIDNIKKHHYPFMIADILVNGKSIYTNEENYNAIIKNGIVLSQGDDIQFNCIYLNYAPFTTNQYEYKLEGYDTEWNICNDPSNIIYHDLTHGKYRLRIHPLNQENPEQAIYITIKRNRNYSSLLLGIFLILSLCYIFILLKKAPKKKTLKTPEHRETEAKYATSKMDNESMGKINLRLQEIMKTQKPWKNPNLKMHELASLVKCSPYTLSQVFSLYLKLNFSDYVNQYRINECKNYMADPAYNKYSLDALVELCGFSSRSSFFRSFKKYTGVTPNEYKSKISS